MPLLNQTLMALSIFFYCLYAWGSLRHFRRSDQVRPGLGALSFVSAIAFAAQLAGIWPTHRLWGGAGAAIPVYAAALGLWVWAVATTRGAELALAFSRDAPIGLVNRGPYRYLRHPFYAAYTLYWLAGCLATLAWWVAVPSAAAIGLYVMAAQSEERKFAASPLADAYAAYRATTGMFVPLLRRTGRGKTKRL
jgi:protein-S-isoprenylcysteine O-methyltransferase Ste14